MKFLKQQYTDSTTTSFIEITDLIFSLINHHCLYLNSIWTLTGRNTSILAKFNLASMATTGDKEELQQPESQPIEAPVETEPVSPVEEPEPVQVTRQASPPRVASPCPPSPSPPTVESPQPPPEKPDSPPYQPQPQPQQPPPPQQQQPKQLDPSYGKMYEDEYSSDKQKEQSAYSRTSSAASFTSRVTPHRSTDFADLLGSMSREFRGTSPAVLENISSHPLLYRQYESTVNPKLSARSKKVIRDAADLALFSPGLKLLLEVCRPKIQFSLSFLPFFCFVFNIYSHLSCLLLLP